MQSTAAQYQYYRSQNDHPHIRAETFTHELKRLLAGNNKALNDETIRRQVALLEQWMNYYRRGLVTADALSAAGILLLNNLHNRLKLSAEALPLLKNESHLETGGREVKANEIVRSIRSSEKMIRGLRSLTNHYAQHHLSGVIMPLHPSTVRTPRFIEDFLLDEEFDIFGTPPTYSRKPIVHSLILVGEHEDWDDLDAEANVL